MNKIDLNGNWNLYYFHQGDINISDPNELQKSELTPIRAVVPGNVELDLIRGGLLPDPFYGDNIRMLKKYEMYEWWYTKEFKVPSSIKGKSVELIFNGTDCIATYWLNGREIGYSDNMFVEHKFNVSNALNFDGINKIAVQLRSPIMEARKKEYDASLDAGSVNWEQLWIRKSPSSYGWDIMPRALSAGLWRSVELIVHDDIEITDLYFYTKSLSEKTAKIGLFFKIKIDDNIDMSYLEMKIQFQYKGKNTFEVREKLFFVAGKIDIEIPEPKLWWPKGYGNANLYEVVTQLLYKDAVVFERRDMIGIRTIKLIRVDAVNDVNGEFLFKINDVPIFVKGSNWVPADVFHSRDKNRYEENLKLFDDLNCNMLRCWGGNVYEDHDFYDLCDKYGIMVWQDFAMACAHYPQEPEFLSVIEEEAKAIVKKLRNHPSIVLWSGDNECDYNFIASGTDPNDNKITRGILPNVVLEDDPFRPYLPSSPYFSPEIIAKKDYKLMPEQHLWGPRDYYKSRFYTENTAHFASEIGYHGCPNVSSIKKFIDKDHLWPWENNSQWIIHCSDPIGEKGPYSYRIKLMADQIKEMFGFYPNNLEDFALASQISQAEALKFFIEMFRLKKWNKTGIIWWNVIDGWPQFSDAVVDYYYTKKLAYYYIKRVQKPVCIMISEPENWHVKVVVANDSNENINGQYNIRDADTDEILINSTFNVAKNENKELDHLRISRGEHRLFLIEWTINGESFGNHYLLGTPPFNFNQYKEWLKKISSLYDKFDSKLIAK